jgi:hypothetical protein
MANVLCALPPCGRAVGLACLVGCAAYQIKGLCVVRLAVCGLALIVKGSSDGKVIASQHLAINIDRLGPGLE